MLITASSVTATDGGQWAIGGLSGLFYRHLRTVGTEDFDRPIPRPSVKVVCAIGDSQKKESAGRPVGSISKPKKWRNTRISCPHTPHSTSRAFIIRYLLSKMATERCPCIQKDILMYRVRSGDCQCHWETAKRRHDIQ